MYFVIRSYPPKPQIKKDNKQEELKNKISQLKRDINQTNKTSCSIDNKEGCCSTVQELLDIPKEQRTEKEDIIVSKMKKQTNKITAQNAVQNTILKYYKPINYAQMETIQPLIQQYQNMLKYDETGNSINLASILDKIDKECA